MSQKNGEKQKKGSLSKTGSTVLFAVVIFLSIIQVVLLNILATSGQRLAAANQKIKTLKEENQKLENEVSLLNSLARIEKIAGESGFVKATNVEILVPSRPIASR